MKFMFQDFLCFWGLVSKIVVWLNQRVVLVQNVFKELSSTLCVISAGKRCSYDNKLSKNKFKLFQNRGQLCIHCILKSPADCKILSFLVVHIVLNDHFSNVVFLSCMALAKQNSFFSCQKVKVRNNDIISTIFCGRDLRLTGCFSLAEVRPSKC